MTYPTLRRARPLFALTLALAALAAGPGRAATQTPAPAADSAVVRTQAISILPLHAVFGFYAGEYERAINNTTTLAVGGSYFSLDDLRYSTVEAKLRYYPSGDALNGLSFGVTAGPTMLSDREYDNEDGGQESRESITGVGIGFEIAKSRLLGVDRRFYYGYGAGLKRIFFNGDDDALFSDAEVVIPTVRLSIGYAF
jgi:hypothetical protein